MSTVQTNDSLLEHTGEGKVPRFFWFYFHGFGFNRRIIKNNNQRQNAKSTTFSNRRVIGCMIYTSPCHQVANKT